MLIQLSGRTCPPSPPRVKQDKTIGNGKIMNASVSAGASARTAAQLSTSSSMPSSSSLANVIGQDNFHVFITAIVRLLPATLTLATPGRPPPPVPGRGGGTAGKGNVGVPMAEGIRSPYCEAECLGMVFECFLETCTESLNAGGW